MCCIVCQNAMMLTRLLVPRRRLDVTRISLSKPMSTMSNELTQKSILCWMLNTVCLLWNFKYIGHCYRLTHQCITGLWFTFLMKTKVWPYLSNFNKGFAVWTVHWIQYERVFMPTIVSLKNFLNLVWSVNHSVEVSWTFMISSNKYSSCSQGHDRLGQKIWT